VNFAVCPDDGSRLKTDPGWRVGARPVLLRCPACGKRYTLSGAGVADAEPGDGGDRMRRSRSGSWRFGHGDMGYLHAALFVRDAARLPVAPAADIPPRLAGEVPDCADVLEPGDRLVAGEQWVVWWRRLVGQAVREGQRSGTRPPAGLDDDFEAVIAHRFGGQQEVFDPPGFGSLAGLQPLRSAVTKTRAPWQLWSAHQPGSGADRPGVFAYPIVREAAESTAAVLGVPASELSGYAHVLEVEGLWAYLAGPGCALCSAALACDPQAASRLLRDVFSSGLSGSGH